MCGIIGYTGFREVIPVLIESLKRLEYRGYDSAGIAYLFNNKIEIIKKKGRIEDLKNLIEKYDVAAHIGIGHTRWATHGKPSDKNAHPHLNSNNSIAIVHNGIIENYKILKERLLKQGIKFLSETDTEVIVHLINFYLKNNDLENAIVKTIKELKGSFALAIISLKEKEKIFVCRYHSPLVIGIGKGENFVASDIPAILNYTNNFIFLDDGEYAVITQNNVDVKNFKGKLISKKVEQVNWDVMMAEKLHYKHFMLKEIYEQPEVIKRLINTYINYETNEIIFNNFENFDKLIPSIKKIDIVACGTSFHSAIIGKLYLEDFANIPVEVDIGSEYRYRKNIIKEDTLLITISQSGETADTLASLRKFKEKNNNKTLTICNVFGSSLARDSDFVIFTEAGPEIGVASTKAYTAQIFCLLLLSLYIGFKKNRLNKTFIKNAIQNIHKIPMIMEKVLKQKEKIYNIAIKYYKFLNFLFLGRYYNYPTALEGALKLKEISYIHAEGYAAGEMKHGPIALIDDKMPVVIIAVKDSVYEKVVSNIEEVKARQGIIILVLNENDKKLKHFADEFIEVPLINDYLSPLITIIPLQLLAYEIANKLGCDVDKPRNLAKSVTVE
ncbi:MAG TPA: glutamine--fructose-6-phosphate transaminase (isomerizing) [bacterium]|nr:glutamine--fructose-6-phosphate transaminase (isomerizing) [bacterium]HPQ19830.1 glutamine--fructose-6-phosphate transaminase (isomerizing) [bacterium]